MKTAEEFWLAVDKSGGADACWPWTGSRKETGYGRTSWRGRGIGAHRLAKVLATNDDVLTPKHALHNCDNPACCNPAHIYWGTHRQNMQDKVARGRQERGEEIASRKRGSKNANAKLVEAQIVEMRERFARGESVRELASAFSVRDADARRIVRGERWRHAGGPIAATVRRDIAA